MKKKGIAGTFALLFGVFGVHRFYLGQRALGILYLIAFGFCFILTVEEDVPAIMVPAIAGFIDALLLFAMPKEDFDEKYNSKRLGEDRGVYSRRERRRRRGTVEGPVGQNNYKKSGIKKFREYDIEGALADFKKALEVNYEDKATHFNLACCYSFLEEEDPAFFHLSKAVDYGFVDFDRINEHDALAFLRSLPRFESFSKNGYHYDNREAPNALPAPQEDLLSSQPTNNESEELKLDLLEQIERLGELRDKGILTQEEFSNQKKKLLQ